MTYKMIVPPEPPIGTVVRAENGFDYTRTEQGWESSTGTPFTWDDMLRGGNELEDVTPLRTWEMPAEPPIGTKIKDREGEPWERTGVGGWAWQLSDSTEMDNTSWTNLVTMLGPLEEIRG